jgi:uncharacterized protein YkwD
MARITIAVAIALVALLTGWAPEADACAGAGRQPSAQTVDSARRAVLCLINRERRHHRLRTVHGDAALRTAAQEHSDTMTSDNFFAHAGTDGTPASRAGWAGYTKGARVWSIGENLGFATGSQGSPRAIFKAWMRSAEHRAVILMGRWRQIGIGITLGSPIGPDGQGMATYTVDFGFRRF